MYDAAVADFPLLLSFVPNKFKTHEMCDKVVGNNPQSLEHVPDCLKTQKMCMSDMSKAMGNETRYNKSDELTTSHI